MPDFRGFAPIPEALEALQQGQLIVLVDDEKRENEGDLVIAAEKCTPEAIAFMASFGRGLICVPLAEERARELGLNLMTDMEDAFGTAFTVSVDARHHTTTGISAFDRCETIKLLADSKSTKNDFRQPGHVFPLIAKPGGVLRRAGHTEASLDLCRLAGLASSAVICEVMKDDGSMARLPDLAEFCRVHGLKLVSIADLIRYRMKADTLIEKVAEARLPTDFGEFKAIGFRDKIYGEEYLALVKGEVSGKPSVLVRVHSGCVTGDIFHSRRCDCNAQLAGALRAIEREGSGVLLYIRHQEGRGIGLLHKLEAYALQDQGLDTVEANERLGFAMDVREYGLGAQVLAALGLTSIRLLTNNPKKLHALEGYGLSIVDRVPIKAEPNPFNARYLNTKRDKMGHLL
ncbi:MAG TPA: bifunctional 3,4-dihydroxy-2-butanone-4-phosphate synthase/GTP cyclohydrolase II [Candidatus Diapherotrites archaeon]|uniref:GTP cyclohydrolase II n=1 Tax=Candidatus Iainarchaeum sp. TaxID=3101447 RepID=A0A7J4JGA2_9ARCH|nr:bifunctional 3,4-dihydroxy-2-butanone-4-phosphate synthase/GTP cyclohydrolase II [Candidatus Diapherotrites archaeon]HIH16782.1 bifunctional 3,4-dihydroxy-2-butanone-4-phosphate synthase/GTP cyclohydrolase II [Candidatus Diapherotrites archaeon]